MASRVKTAVERPSSSEAILDAAERVFARFGYEGATMKLIAEETGLAQALLHYYFKTKEKLYEAVFERRASVINAYRERELDALFAGDRTPSLESVLDVLFSPAAAALGSGPNSGGAFTQIVSAVVVGQDERSISMMIRHYDPIAKRFIRAFRDVLPGLTAADAVWAYLFAHGARMNLYAKTGRAGRLVKGAEEGFDVALVRLRSFTAAGIRQLAEASKAAQDGRPRSARGKMARVA
jgi:AcrR family transcriptional regulator